MEANFTDFRVFQGKGVSVALWGGCGPMGGSGQTKFEHNDIFYD